MILFSTSYLDSESKRIAGLTVKVDVYQGKTVIVTDAPTEEDAESNYNYQSSIEDDDPLQYKIVFKCTGYPDHIAMSRM